MSWAATLTATCTCGASVTKLCATLADLPGAQQSMLDDGWVWADNVGMRCSVACIEAVPPAGERHKATPATFVKIAAVKDTGDLFA